VFKVDLLYYLGVDRGFISGERASNKTDMAHLYYLPFCMLFTSGENLHRRTAPLFLRRDQSFAEAAAFKAALKELDDHYTRLPDEIKELGVMAFAHYPPKELDNLVVELWDKHMRAGWRDDAETPEQVLERWQAMQEEGRAAELRSRVEAAQPVADGERQLGDGEPDYIVIRRQVPVGKGKPASKRHRTCLRSLRKKDGDAGSARPGVARAACPYRHGRRELGSPSAKLDVSMREQKGQSDSCRGSTVSACPSRGK